MSARSHPRKHILIPVDSNGEQTWSRVVLHSPGTLAAVLVRVAEVRAVTVVDSIQTLDFTRDQSLIDARVAVGRRRARRSGVVGRHAPRSGRRAGGLVIVRGATGVEQNGRESRRTESLLT